MCRVFMLHTSTVAWPRLFTFACRKHFIFDTYRKLTGNFMYSIYHFGLSLAYNIGSGRLGQVFVGAAKKLLCGESWMHIMRILFVVVGNSWSSNASTIENHHSISNDKEKHILQTREWLKHSRKSDDDRMKFVTDRVWVWKWQWIMNACA